MGEIESPEHLYKLALVFLKRNYYDVSVLALKISAEKDYLPAFLQLYEIVLPDSSESYSNVKKYKERISESFKWFEEQANTEDPHSQYNLGLCYHYGLGINQDFEQSVFW